MTVARDPRGLIPRIDHPDGLSLALDNDEAGRRTGITLVGTDGARCDLQHVLDPLGRSWVYGYDERGNLVAVTDPLGHRTDITYDAAGRLSGIRDYRGELTRFAWDGFGRVLAVEDPLGGVMRFGHDGLDRLERVENQLGRAWTFERDAAGRVVAETDFDGLRTTYAHDRAGRPTEKLAADGTRTVYEHDASGLLTRESMAVPGAAEPAVTTFAYDGAGQLVAARAGEVEVLLEWDGLGRVVSETVDGRRIASRYDCCGNRVERMVNRDAFRPRAWRYAWDGKDRLVGCETPSGEVWAYGYDPFGRRLWKRRTDAGADAAAGGGVVGTAYSARATIWHDEPGTFRPLAWEDSDGSLAYVGKGQPALHEKRRFFNHINLSVCVSDNQSMGIRLSWLPILRLRAGYGTPRDATAAAIRAPWVRPEKVCFQAIDETEAYDCV